MKPPSGVKPTRMFSCFFLMNMLPAVRLKKTRSEEHTSELQSQSNLVCRLLLEKKNTNAVGGVVAGPADDDNDVAVYVVVLSALFSVACDVVALDDDESVPQRVVGAIDGAVAFH